jgi:hypothetical protein
MTMIFLIVRSGTFIGPCLEDVSQSCDPAFLSDSVWRTRLEMLLGHGQGQADFVPGGPLDGQVAVYFAGILILPNMDEN